MSDENILKHHGILGMRWGIRKPKSTIGKSYNKKNNNYKNKPYSKSKNNNYKNKPYKKRNNKRLTDKDLERIVNRLSLEKKYKELSRPNIEYGKRLALDIVSKSVKDIGSKQLTKYIEKYIKSVK